MKGFYLPVRYFDDVVCELHALEWHGLPLYSSAGTINKRLRSAGQISSVKVSKVS